MFGLISVSLCENGTEFFLISYVFLFLFSFFSSPFWNGPLISQRLGGKAMATDKLSSIMSCLR